MIESENLEGRRLTEIELEIISKIIDMLFQLRLDVSGEFFEQIEEILDVTETLKFEIEKR